MGLTTAPLDAAGYRFEDFAEQNWPREEIFDGSLHVTPLVPIGHQRILGNLALALNASAPQDFEVLMGVNVLRRTEVDRLLIPDIAVLDADAVDRGCAAGAAWLAPEDLYLAVEVISPPSRTIDLYLKKQFYAEWRIGSYWVLDPETEQLHEFGDRSSKDCWLADVDVSGLWSR